MYMQQAETLEQSGKLKEAERLYLTIKRVDRAMTMYKSRRQYREMARLVRTHKPELLEQTLMRIAQELECEGNLRQAEQYYMQVPITMSFYSLPCSLVPCVDFRLCLFPWPIIKYQ